MLNVEIGQRVLAEHALDGLAEWSFGQHVQLLPLGTVRPSEVSREERPRTSQRPSQQHHLIGMTRLLQVAQTSGQRVQSIAPGERRETPGAAAAQCLHWTCQAVGMVLLLDHRLAASAQLATVDRVVWVTLGFLGAALDDPHEHAAATGALAAGCGVEILEGGQRVFCHAQPALGLHLFRGRRAACERDRADRGGGSGGEKLAPTQFGHTARSSVISNGRWHIRLVRWTGDDTSRSRSC